MNRRETLAAQADTRKLDDEKGESRATEPHAQRGGELRLGVSHGEPLREEP